MGLDPPLYPGHESLDAKAAIHGTRKHQAFRAQRIREPTRPQLLKRHPKLTQVITTNQEAYDQSRSIAEPREAVETVTRYAALLTQPLKTLMRATLKGFCAYAQVFPPKQLVRLWNDQPLEHDRLAVYYVQ